VIRTDASLKRERRSYSSFAAWMHCGIRATCSPLSQRCGACGASRSEAALRGMQGRNATLNVRCQTRLTRRSWWISAMRDQFASRFLVNTTARCSIDGDKLGALLWLTDGQPHRCAALMLAHSILRRVLPADNMYSTSIVCHFTSTGRPSINYIISKSPIVAALCFILHIYHALYRCFTNDLLHSPFLQ
jgi:hypothetical protein